ncbi:hypothetical protein E4U43_000504 [Claviceps pusilla]|uniref:Secreted protein n=1 Tax=Claviceps pusilla TaxID=123648 RepID=A0A9P7NGG0_9HYPO|nr:hypothetical protein E4U43_000504 [Claviceps pusilla]
MSNPLIRRSAHLPLIRPLLVMTTLCIKTDLVMAPISSASTNRFTSATLGFQHLGQLRRLCHKHQSRLS